MTLLLEKTDLATLNKKINQPFSISNLVPKAILKLEQIKDSVMLFEGSMGTSSDEKKVYTSFVKSIILLFIEEKISLLLIYKEYVRLLENYSNIHANSIEALNNDSYYKPKLKYTKTRIFNNSFSQRAANLRPIPPSLSIENSNYL